MPRNLDLNGVAIERVEELACQGDSAAHRHLTAAIMLIRSLAHELEDPNYLYVGRIPRGAILSRNAEIDKLRDEVKGLKEELRKLNHDLDQIR